MAAIARYVRELERMGAPVERLLARAGIRPDLLGHDELAVPLKSAFRFGELACQALGTEHLGLRVGLATSLADLGPYGCWLQRAVTVRDHLRRGIALYNALITGQRFWLSSHGDELRLNLSTALEDGIGSYQSHLESLAVTIARLREATGLAWSPREISFAYRASENLPDVDVFAGSHVVRGSGQTYLTIPRSIMGMCFPRNGGDGQAASAGSPAISPLPEDLAGLVRLQIEALLPDRTAKVEIVAETLAVSRRSLQRGLAEEGSGYSQLLAEVRTRRAVDRLSKADDTPIADLAYELGYSNPSNFTRAFRRRTGVSPETFRNGIRSGSAAIACSDGGNEE